MIVLHAWNVVLLTASVIVGVVTGGWLVATVVGGIYAFCALVLLILKIAGRTL
jgi:hypothetical protein